jgi:hypothetical protein
LSIGVGEFRDTLTAGPTGGTEHGAGDISKSSHHGNPPDLLPPCHPHRADRACLGARTYGVGRVLDIAAYMHGA